MTKRMMALVLLLALLAPALPARALTNAEKYDAALQGMVGYLSGDTTTTPGDLFVTFSGCSSYQHGASLALYAKVLDDLSREDYAAMAANARAWGEKIRRGDMTRAVLEKLG
jgi:hypothetical protein